MRVFVGVVRSGAEGPLIREMPAPSPPEDVEDTSLAEPGTQTTSPREPERAREVPRRRETVISLVLCGVGLDRNLTSSAVCVIDLVTFVISRWFRESSQHPASVNPRSAPQSGFRSSPHPISRSIVLRLNIPFRCMISITQFVTSHQLFVYG